MYYVKLIVLTIMLQEAKVNEPGKLHIPSGTT